MKIVDSFIFYNELKMLNYRLSVLYPIVDHIIIVEATKTFSGKPKQLYFQENRDKFAPFLDKIIHVIDDELIDSSNFGNGVDSWTNEAHQRNYINKGVEKLNLNDDDLLMISDCDEIPDIDYIKSFFLIYN